MKDGRRSNEHMDSQAKLDSGGTNIGERIRRRCRRLVAGLRTLDGNLPCICGTAKCQLGGVE